MNIFKATNFTVPFSHGVAFAGVLFAPFAYAIEGSPWMLIGALLVWQLLNIVGISAGVHRYFSHRSFECNRFWQWVMAYLTTVSLVGPPCIWAEAHIKHHRNADKSGDPYLRFMLTGATPLTHTTLIGKPFLLRMLKKDSIHRLTLKYYWLFALSYPLALVILGAFSEVNIVDALLWLFLVPVGLSQLTLRFILWTGHLKNLGYRNYATDDGSNNFWLAALIGGGEGWHNNHHHDQRNPNLGYKWWEIDLGYWFIRMIKQ